MGFLGVMVVSAAVACAPIVNSPASAPPVTTGSERHAESAEASGSGDPESREELFDVLADRIVVACRLRALQEAAGLSETQCVASVRAREDACRTTARVAIPVEVVESKELYEDELKTFIDCLIPPTDLGDQNQEGSLPGTLLTSESSERTPFGHYCQEGSDDALLIQAEDLAAGR